MRDKDEIILYQTEENYTKIQVILENETVWLSLNQLAELFQRDKSVISRHIKNIIDEWELIKDSVVANYPTTTNDGKTYQKEHIN